MKCLRLRTGRPDGRYLLARLARQTVPDSGGRAAGAPEAVNLDPSLRCNNDHNLSPDGPPGGDLGQFAVVTASRRVYVAAADGSNPHVLTPASPSYFHGWSPGWPVPRLRRAAKRALQPVSCSEGGRGRTAADQQAGLRRRSGLLARRQVDLFQLKPFRRVGHLADALRRRRSRRCPSGTGDQRRSGGLVPATLRPMGSGCCCSHFLAGTTGHNDRLDGCRPADSAIARQEGEGWRAAGNADEVSSAGQGTINVNSWSPDSKCFAFVIYEPIPPAGQAAAATR